MYDDKRQCNIFKKNCFYCLLHMHMAKCYANNPLIYARSRFTDSEFPMLKWLGSHELVHRSMDDALNSLQQPFIIFGRWQYKHTNSSSSRCQTNCKSLGTFSCMTMRSWAVWTITCTAAARPKRLETANVLKKVKILNNSSVVMTLLLLLLLFLWSTVTFSFPFLGFSSWQRRNVMSED